MQALRAAAATMMQISYIVAYKRGSKGEIKHASRVACSCNNDANRLHSCI
jgi:hypothetical protein